MKKIFFAILIVISFAETITAKTTDSDVDPAGGRAIISGHGEILYDGLEVNLVRWDGMSGETVATDTVQNRQFRFNIPVDNGFSMWSVSIHSPEISSMIHNLYITPGAEVEIDAQDGYMMTWRVKSNVPEQDEYELYINNNKELWNEYQKEMVEYRKIMDSAQSSEEYQKLEKQFSTAHNHKNDSIGWLLQQGDLELLKTRPIGRVWLDKAYEYAKTARFNNIISDEMQAMYANLDDSVKNSPKGKAIYGFLYPDSHIGLGDQFPDTEFYDIEGNPHRFSEFQGKWRLVDFWSSGCAPCRWALPEMRELKEMYPETLELISLSLDTENMWRQQSKELQLIGNNWNEGKEDYGMFTRLQLTSRPSFLLVSPEGIIEDIWVGYMTGQLKQKMRFNTRPKGKTEYTQKENTRTIHFPKYASNRTDDVLDIEKIELNNKETKVYFSFVFIPNNWIRIPAEAYLTDATDAKYSIIDSEGIIPGEPLFPDAEGKGAFSITFEAIPECIDTVDFHEDISNDGWSITGIRLQQ